ncbi:MAG TPA: hypothetical protein VHX38_02815 [Pseudonocardiaceae bacterium]|jgi:hypothetical protein|nr:hypothetical protein [Pseudonocardiaceae bacterium]
MAAILDQRRRHFQCANRAVPSLGSARRLQALYAAGVPQFHLDRMLHCGRPVTVAAARVVEELFLGLCGHSLPLSPADEARVIRHRWVTAAAWTDLPIDDPWANPVMDPATSIAVQHVLCHRRPDPWMAQRVRARLAGRLRIRDLTLIERAYVALALLQARETRNSTQVRSGLAPKVVHAMHAYLCT